MFSVSLDRDTAVVNGQNYDLDAIFVSGGNLSLLVDGVVSSACVVGSSLDHSQHHIEVGIPFQINIDRHTHDVLVDDQRSLLLKTLQRGEVRSAGPAEIVAPMPGLVAKVLVSVGDQVKQGQGIIILEAMKMENEIRTTQAGLLNEILVRPGQAVEKGEILARVGTDVHSRS